jgi:hypothetical protein
MSDPSNTPPVVESVPESSSTLPDPLAKPVGAAAAPLPPAPTTAAAASAGPLTKFRDWLEAHFAGVAQMGEVNAAYILRTADSLIQAEEKKLAGVAPPT